MLRRVLWLVPTLFLVSVAAFQFLAWTIPIPRVAGPWEQSHREPLPVFVNTHPNNAGDLAEHLMQDVARGGAESPRAARALIRLGGAGLPHILPRLDELAPRERGRVALALVPLAERMGIASPRELEDPEAASLFWSRFWQDRELDYRPVVVRRLIKRLSERSLALRRDDVIQLDTYALPELIQALGRVRNREDIARVRRLTALLAHMTENDWQIDAAATRDEARAVVRRWQSWWLLEGSNYVTLGGIGKATALVTQTRYGHWVRSLPLEFGARAGTATVLGALLAGIPYTLLLLLTGSVGGYLLGTTFAVVSIALHPKPLSRALTLTAWLALLLPLAVSAFESTASEANPLAAGFVMLGFGFGVAYLYQRSATLSKLDASWWPNTPLSARSTVALLRETAEPPLALLSTSLPLGLLVSTLVETAFDLPGLGQRTVGAVRDGDIEWLMAMALVGTTFAALLQMAGDALTVGLGYRAFRRAPHEVLRGPM